MTTTKDSRSGVQPTPGQDSRGGVVQPRLGPVGWARWAWRTLTSMRTALFLLLLLSIAAVPGSIFPQRSIDAGRVANYLATHATLGPWLDRLSFFDVYSSPWFSAVYLLLVVSLIGCIVPRSRLHWRTLRGTPPRAPAYLERLDQHTQVTLSVPPQEALDRARTLLRRKRFRVVSHDATSVSAENGYLRETGNLLFHTALCVVIVGVAFGHLFGWRGDVIVPAGQTFGSSLTNYDTFNPGALVDPNSLPPFTIKVDAMDVEFEDQVGGAQFGAPRKFEATTTVVAQPGAAPVTQALSVNHPLSVDGADVYLLGNGYAPVVTVKDAAGKVLYSQATPFLAQESNTYKSVGAIKVPAASPKQLGFSGFFLPTADPSSTDGPQSLFPDTRNPELDLSLWTGDLFPGGRPQSVYTLNTTSMSQVTGTDGQPLLLKLKPGQTVTLPNGLGTISLDSVDRFAGLSVRTDPGKGLTLVAALLTILGLLASLLVRRRRVFVRVRPAGEGDTDATGTVVDLGALSKNADPTLARDLQAIAEDLRETTAETSAGRTAGAS